MKNKENKEKLTKHQKVGLIAAIIIGLLLVANGIKMIINGVALH